ncbi:MAG TPA: serine/threonine-protein kinase [Pseudonocardiaceae bacterium]|nr:serine/threonine-protein kinase [Pseudonocardiaceae bacterium]
MPEHTVAGQRVIGSRYELLDVLGRGGMGVVWRAHDRVIGRHVAVKELRLPHDVDDRERDVFQQRVLREARTAGRLNDPAIVTVHDVIDEGGTTFIVMELVAAQTLSDLVRAQGPLPPHQVVSLAEQVLGALGVAHAAGIVHRDIKPSNLMLLGNGRVKLADFGIAQAVDDPKLTTSGNLIGSPGYLAPERVHGNEATPAADLWALGAVLYFAVEGRDPFERATTAATLHAVLNEPPQFARCPPALATIIRGLLIADPQGRLTASQVLALAHTSDVTVSIMGTAPYTAVSTPPHGLQPTRVAARPTKSRRWALVGLAALLVVGAAVGGYFVGHGTGGTSQPAAFAATLTYGSPDAQIPKFELDENECGNGAVVPGRSVTSNESVDCDSPHDYEVFAETSAFNNSSLHVQPPAAQQLAAEAQHLHGPVLLALDHAEGQDDRADLHGTGAQRSCLAGRPGQPGRHPPTALRADPRGRRSTHRFGHRPQLLNGYSASRVCSSPTALVSSSAKRYMSAATCFGVLR